MASSDPTFVGQVASVVGGTVRVRLRRDMPTTLVLVEGESYRVGQIGGFFRMPIGYTQLYAVCSQVGADAVPGAVAEAMPVLERDQAMDDSLAGYRWMTVVLFGESVGKTFERGVGQYPTVGDEVHFVTKSDLEIIYSSSTDNALKVGTIASSNGIPAQLDLNKLVSRHSAIVGSTGAGKSNLVSVLLEALSSEQFPSARVLVIDPHGEYSAVARDKSKVFRINPAEGESRLIVPFWALPFDELLAITFGGMSPSNEAAVRDRVQELKRAAALKLKKVPLIESITADSPIPFSLHQLWFELDDFERQTFRGTGTARVATKIVTPGDASTLSSNVYEPYRPGSQEPYKNPSPRGLSKQLELTRSRLTDSRYSFLFNPSAEYTPTLEGQVQSDLDGLIASWIGHESTLTLLDVSDIPSEVASDVVGLLVRIVYDSLFWAAGLAIGGRRQPLLIVLDEAHRFLPDGKDTSSHRILTRVAKEGRKYGVGLMIVTQRPSEIDGTVLSQCGTMISLRTTSPKDRERVSASFPDDLGSLVDLLPSLRTGEGLFVGEAMHVPSRVRIRHSSVPTQSGDPDTKVRWTQAVRPDPKLYSTALRNWRNQRKD
ncbi:MAG TPA: ATP-binding protein [Rhizomicrobium sp.]